MTCIPIPRLLFLIKHKDEIRYLLDYMTNRNVELSDLSLPNAASMRGVLINTLQKDPELFLTETTHLDTFFIITSIYDQFGPSGVNPQDEPVYRVVNADLHSVYKLPFRIALIGWMKDPAFPFELLKRIFDYAMGYTATLETNKMREIIYQRIEEGFCKPEVLPYYLKGETYVARGQQ